MEHDSSDHHRDADFLAALHENSIVACYEDLPEWTFVFAQMADGDCEVFVYDRDRRQCLAATGDAMAVIMNELREHASKGVLTF